MPEEVKRPPAKQIIVNFLEEELSRNDKVLIRNGAFQRDVPSYGIDRYKKYHNPSTYDRTFRKMRELGYIHGTDGKQIKVVEVNRDSKEKYFEVSYN